MSVQSSHVWSMKYNVRTLNRIKPTILQCTCDQQRLGLVCASTHYIKQASCILYDQWRVWTECAVAVALFIPLWTARLSMVNTISEGSYQNVQARTDQSLRSSPRRFDTPSDHRGYLRLAKALIRLLRSADVQSQSAGWFVSSYKFYCRFCHAQTHARVVCANLNDKHIGYNFQHTTFWNIFLVLPREHYLHFMQIVSTAWNIKSCFHGNEKKENEFNQSSAELAQKTLSRQCARFIQCVSFTR